VGVKPGAALSVWVVSSLAGGTGSGILLDILYLTDRLLRSKGQAAPKIRAVLFTPGSFTSYLSPEIIMSNGYAAMQEISYFLSNRGENHFQFVSSVPDQPSWKGVAFGSWPVFESAIPIDSTIQGGGAMVDTALYENAAEMLSYLQLSAAEGAAASPLDNCLQNASSTDRLTAFGYIALRKPVHLFQRYLAARRGFEVMEALLGKEFRESEHAAMADKWIEQVVEPITGRLLARQEDYEIRLADLRDDRLSSAAVSEEIMDRMADRDEDKVLTQDGGEGLNLRRRIKQYFEELKEGGDSGIRSLQARLEEQFINDFFDDKDRFIKKGAQENAAAFVSTAIEGLEKTVTACLNDFRDIRKDLASQDCQRKLADALRRAVNRSIGTNGIAFANGLVQHCDNLLDALRIGRLAQLRQNFQKLRLALQSEIQSMKVSSEDEADDLRAKVKSLVGLVKEKTVADCQAELIHWLCAGDREGWIDKELEPGLADLLGEAVKAHARARSAYENDLPKTFRASAAEVTTRYLPNPEDMLGATGWKQERENAFSRYYASLFAGEANSAPALLSKLGDGGFLRATGRGSGLFTSFLPESAGGELRPPTAIISILTGEIEAWTEASLNANTDSEARKFLDKPLAKIFEDFPERQAELKNLFGSNDRLFFPLAQGNTGGRMSISIYAGNNPDFARELGYTDADPWVQEGDVNVLLKLYFQGAFSFTDYFHHGAAEGSYKSVLEKIVLGGHVGHQPHIHRSFVNSAAIGQNVRQAVESLAPSVEFAAGISTPYGDFDRAFATCWLYSELPNHLSEESLGLVFEQALLEQDSSYAPFFLRNSQGVQLGGWVESADAIQLIEDKIKIEKGRIKTRVRNFRGTAFDVYEAMRKDEPTLLAMLKDYELKLRKTTHGVALGEGIDRAVEIIISELDACAADPRTKGRWANQIATVRQNLTADRGILPHVRVNILRVDG
jgi:hypothetical protein